MERKFRITVDGREYQVTVEDLTDGGGQLYPQPGSMVVPPAGTATAAAGAVPARPAAGPGDVVSSLGGIVESVLVVLGQEVQAGERVAVIEAMKMKTPMITQRAGRVVAIAVKAGDTVDAGQTLVTLV